MAFDSIDTQVLLINVGVFYNPKEDKYWSKPPNKNTNFTNAEILTGLTLTREISHKYIRSYFGISNDYMLITTVKKVELNKFLFTNTNP